MKTIKFRTALYHCSVVFFLTSTFMITSCNPRQARVVGKVLNNVEHMEDETEALSDENSYEENRQTETAPVREVRYYISGIYQKENGEIEHLKDNVVIETSQGLYLADGLGNPTAPVYKNDTQVITETRVVRYSFDEDETELRPYNVSAYAYKCSNGIGTFYFNLGSRIN